MTTEADLCAVDFIQGDVEQASRVITDYYGVDTVQKFDLILCIEAMHCITNLDALMVEAKSLLSENSQARFVLAD